MNIKLRYLELSDIDNLLLIENNKKYWHLSGVRELFTKEELLNYISNSTQNIKEAKQLRFVIDVNNQFTGLLDLYEYDEINNSAGVGIFTIEEFRNKGIATRSLQKLIDYCIIKFKITSLFARIENDNFSSIKVFEKAGFKIKTKLPNYLQKGTVKVDCREYWKEI